MKNIVYLALIGSISAIHLEGESGDWKEYRASRGEHDCAIKENQNWLVLVSKQSSPPRQTTKTCRIKIR